MKKLTDAEKLALIKKWSDWFYEHTETFEGVLGVQLAYLWPAIVKDTRIDVPIHSPLAYLLEEIPRTEDIWQFITTVTEG